MVVVDGKTMRGARTSDTGPSSAVGHGPRHGRCAVPGEGGRQVQPEAPVLRDLLEPPGLDGVVVTADAMAHPGRHHHQIPIKTTYTSHQTTDPPTPLNRLCRPSGPFTLLSS